MKLSSGEDSLTGCLQHKGAMFGNSEMSGKSLCCKVMETVFVTRIASGCHIDILYWFSFMQLNTFSTCCH